ncbi:hypothetical protein [Spiroplasma diminutum]|uniref:Uncharacterized protein n=1 Tax=Spiroplasma diminutum CUAS-1 TaxID=1276221 RepID=S5M2G2_9MOLU|nr:hypothetical protein [Spiroplasma diminutum]AGR42272.1 hypothetical protein SDIMI_v3c05680 [Spiroplasma diminutum CUAS-1]
MEKRFNKISGKNGFYDYDNQLNYFEYFNIKGEDLEKAFLLFKKYENNMHELKQNIESQIQMRYEFYISNSYNKETKRFTPVRNESDRRVAKAMFTSSIILASRLILQEYNMLSTVNKLLYNVDIKVVKLFKEKYNYSIYKKSLKEYYETLSAWSLFFYEKNNETSLILSKMDEYVEKDIYFLEEYKDIFLYFWMYTYIKSSCDLSDYKYKHDNTKRVYPRVNNNVLSPMDFDYIFKYDNDFDEEEKRKLLVKDFRSWSLEAYYASIEEHKNKYYNELKIWDNLTFNEYFKLSNSLSNIFLNSSYYLMEQLEKEVFTETASKNEKIHTKEEVEFVINFLTFDKNPRDYHDLKIDSYYNLIYKKPIFNYIDSNYNRILISFPEFIWMSHEIQRDYNFMDREIVQNFNRLLKNDFHYTLNDQLKKIQKRFNIITAFDTDKISLFSNDGVAMFDRTIANSVIYNPTLNIIMLVLTNFYSNENISWLNAKRTIDTFSPDSKLVQTIFSKTLNVVSKDIKKLKKQLKKMGIVFKDEENVRIEGLLFVNDVLSAIPKVKVSGFDIHIVDISTMEYFTNSYIYKK